MAVESNPLQFRTPIPGQSLTSEPKGRPWENPAKYNTEDEALQFYLNQLESPDRIQHLIQLLDAGLPAADLVDTLTLSGVMEGLHTIDVAVLIAPALFKLVSGIAEVAGIDYKDGVREENDGSMSSHMIQMAQKRPEAEELIEQVEGAELENIQDAALGIMSRSGDPDQSVEE